MKKTSITNAGLKLLAVAIAFLIWLVVANVNDPVTTRNYSGITVEYSNIDSFGVDKTYSIQNNSDDVKIWVTARKSILDKLQAGDFTAIADFRNLTETNGIPYTIKCTNSSLSRSNWECEPAALQIKIEDIVQNSFAVTVVTTGRPADNYEVGTTSVREGDTLNVAGPESVVGIIDKVSVTINVNSMNKNDIKKGDIKVTDRNGAELTDAQMKNLKFTTSSGELLTKRRVNVAVEMWKARSNISLLVDTVGKAASGYRVTNVATSPETVSLAGSDAIWEGIGDTLEIPDFVSVDGASESFETSIDLTEYLQDNYKKILRVADGATSTISVKVTIEKVGTETIEVPISELNITGQPSDLDLTLTPADKLLIEVISGAEVQGALTSDDISGSLDLSSYTKEGHYTVPVEITLPEGYELASDVTINVNLSQKEATETIKN